MAAGSDFGEPSLEIEMHELQRVLERQVRELATSVLGPATELGARWLDESGRERWAGRSRTYVPMLKARLRFLMN